MLCSGKHSFYRPHSSSKRTIRAFRTQAKSTTYAVLDYFKGFVFAFNQDDIPVEFKKIKGAGKQHLETLFPPQGEQSNANDPSGLTRALFDDQIHDSRAWFMHSALGSREPWAVILSTV
jgi:hypothetical protein